MDNVTDWEDAHFENVTKAVTERAWPCDLPSHRLWRGQETPSWDSVRLQLRWFFLLHAYGFACSFFILAFYAFFSILNIRTLGKLLWWMVLLVSVWLIQTQSLKGPHKNV